MRLYEEVNVWRRVSEFELICYRCFKVIPEGGYCVQSADYHRANSANETAFQRQYVELLLDQCPEQRSEVWPTLEEAIEHFRQDFDC